MAERQEASGPRSELAANLLASGVSLAVIAALLLAVEGVLRLSGIGAPEAAGSRLAYQRIYLPILEDAERRDGTPVRITADPRLPFQSIRAEKPEDGLRVVVFGGSAAAGLGFSPNASFPRQLERMLEEAYPGRPIEVLNLGIVALASRQVAVLVAEVCARYEPDALVVYSGNNEFLEIHAEKVAALRHGAVDRLRALAERSHLLRALRLAIHGRPQPPSLAAHRNARDQLRATQDRIARDIALDPAERAQILDQYEANLAAMTEAAAAAGTPLVLASVASNWRWRGRSDLPDDWAEELAPGAGPAELLRALDERLARAPARDRAELLFRRAVVLESLGDDDDARAAYRAAMNEDPHLRRALDEMNERVARVAAGSSAVFLDSVAVIAGDTDDGIPGFDHFYDYVHFTPRGAVVLAASVAGALAEAGAISTQAAARAADTRDRQLGALEALDGDSLAVDRWLGLGDAPRAQIEDRDLWKYDRMLQELDARIEANGDDARALVARGNSRYFRVGGAAQAARDYRSALALLPDDPVTTRNLELLESERPLPRPD